MKPTLRFTGIAYTAPFDRETAMLRAFQAGRPDIYLDNTVRTAHTTTTNMAQTSGLHLQVRKHLQTIHEILIGTTVATQPLLKVFQDRGLPREERNALAHLFIEEFYPKVALALVQNPNDPPATENIEFPIQKPAIDASASTKIKSLLGQIFPNSSKTSILTLLDRLGISAELKTEITGLGRQIEAQLSQMANRFDRGILDDVETTTNTLAQAVKKSAERAKPIQGKVKLLLMADTKGRTALDILKRMKQLDDSRSGFSRLLASGVQASVLLDEFKGEAKPEDISLGLKFAKLKEMGLVRSLTSLGKPRWALTPAGIKATAETDPSTVFKVTTEDLTTFVKDEMQNLENEQKAKKAQLEKLEFQFQENVNAVDRIQADIDTLRTEALEHQDSADKTEDTFVKESLMGLARDKAKRAANLERTNKIKRGWVDNFRPIIDGARASYQKWLREMDEIMQGLQDRQTELEMTAENQDMMALITSFNSGKSVSGANISPLAGMMDKIQETYHKSTALLELSSESGNMEAEKAHQEMIQRDELEALRQKGATESKESPLAQAQGGTKSKSATEYRSAP